MKAKYLILTLLLTLSAGAALAAINYGHSEPETFAPAVRASLSAVPRVVVTASRPQVADAQVARIVVVGHRADADTLVAESD